MTMTQTFLLILERCWGDGTTSLSFLMSQTMPTTLTTGIRWCQMLLKPGTGLTDLGGQGTKAISPKHLYSSLANFIDFIYFYHNEIFSEGTCLVLVLLLSLTCIHNSYNRSRTLRSVPEMRFVSFLCSVVRTFSCSIHTISQKRLAWPTSKKMPMRCSGGSLPTNITQPTQTSTAAGWPGQDEKGNESTHMYP